MKWQLLLSEWLGRLLKSLIVPSLDNDPHIPVLVVPAPPVVPQDEPLPAPSKNDLLERYCAAVEDFEGYIPPSPAWPHGSPAFRNCSPGNLKCVPFMNKLATGKDASGFCVFPDHETGVQALRNMILNVAKGKSVTYNAKAKELKLASGSELNLMQYMHIYTGDPEPSPTNYANFVAHRMGVDSKTFRLGELV